MDIFPFELAHYASQHSTYTASPRVDCCAMHVEKAHNCRSFNGRYRGIKGNKLEQIVDLSGASYSCDVLLHKCFDAAREYVCCAIWIASILPPTFSAAHIHSN